MGIRLCGPVLLLAAGAVFAQTAPPAYLLDLPSVAVNLNADPAWRSYKQLKVGEVAFGKYHRLAPRADLYFALFPLQPWLDFDGVAMSLQFDEGMVPVPLGRLGRFRLPEVKTANLESAELVLNQKSGTYRWRPDIRTPGVPENYRRLGDLRLECEVADAVNGNTTSLFPRSSFSAPDGSCRSEQIKNLFPSRKSVVAIQMAYGNRIQIYHNVLGNKYGGYVYYVPLHDQTWPDDALFELIYRNPPEE